MRIRRVLAHRAPAERPCAFESLERVCANRKRRDAVRHDLSSGTRPPEPTPRLRFVCGSVLDPRALDDAMRGAEVPIHLASVRETPEPFLSSRD